MHGIVCITPKKHHNSRLQEVISLVSAPTERKRGTSYFYESGETRSYQHRIFVLEKKCGLSTVFFIFSQIQVRKT